MLSEKLKTETHTNHQELEKKLVAQMKAIRSEADYAALLQLFYTYFGGLEKWIDQYITAADLPDHTERRKTEAIANDIRSLGAKPAALATDEALPTITNKQQAFGAMYVIEGSTLGGKIISKMMAQQLNITNDKGLSFFSGYGENTGSMWQKFKETLNLQADIDTAEQDVINAANQTFLKFKEWFEKHANKVS